LQPPVFESKISDLLNKDYPKEKVEASGIYLVNDYYYIIFDNSALVAKIHASLKDKSKNSLLGSNLQKSNFEGITYDPVDKKFLIVEELTMMRKGPKAMVHEFEEFKGFTGKWVVDLKMESSKNGMEGITYFQESGEEYLAILCEKAKCSKKGNLLILKKQKSIWIEHGVISFKVKGMKDYSDIDIRDGRVAIVSQKSSKLWISSFKIQDMQFAEGKLYTFPLVNQEGKFEKGTETAYCAVEGVTWIDKQKLAFVSDVLKSKNQDSCSHKNGMLHIFAIP
jgi:hypothetical protein